jgi:hypothetical protein
MLNSQQATVSPPQVEKNLRQKKCATVVVSLKKSFDCSVGFARVMVMLESVAARSTGREGF